MTQDNGLDRHTIKVNDPIDLPAPDAQQIRKYAATNGILVDFQYYDDEQTMFRRLVRCCYGLTEIEIYNAIIEIEV